MIRFTTILICYLFTCFPTLVKLDSIKHDNVHKLMDTQDLRRIFYVDSHDQVPEYEILKLQVNPDEDGKLNEIVMKLSTFGKDYKLRLKRNVDFQQRIEDMKIFMAESTKDGQLRYTEIKGHQASAQNQLNQNQNQNQDQNQSQSQSESSKENQNNQNIGSTYHDEDNLAALLIDHDRKTGQIRVDGTIGNDFVIKPMPQATIDLERSATKSGNKSSFSSAQGSGNLEQAIHMHDDDEMFLDEDEAIEMAHLQAVAMGDFNHTTPAKATPFTNQTNQTASLLAPQQLDYNNKQNNKQFSLPQPRTLSKAASERKWKKYRKFMAQTQVPKPGPFQSRYSNSDEDHQQTNKQSSSSASRARRHTNVHNKQQQQVFNDQQNRQQQTVPKTRTLQVAHHIVYRQKPSSEASSKEHQHSFMISPQDYLPASMEQVASSFSPQRLSKRSVNSNNENNNNNNYEDMIENQTGNAPIDIVERLARRQATANRGATSNGGAFQEEEEDLDSDFLHDPMGGQFYLEPGSVTGFERAGYSDWSLINDKSSLASSSRRNFAPPPYALNSTSESGAGAEAEAVAGDYFNGTTSNLLATNSTNLNNINFNNRRRYKRQAASGHHRMDVRSSSSRQVRRKRQAPDTVWPEVLLVVDYDSFLLHGGDSRDVKRYFVSFWNGVDLRYKLLYHPKIRISLAGMIVAKDREATPYLERNRLRAPNADAVDAAGALTDMGKYLYREDRLPTYDLAVVITKLDMCRRRYEGGRCNRGTAGFAYVGGACVVNKRLEKVNSVAIIEDSGGFSGIIVAAHEVGHLLGCVHDGSPPPSYLGGPGATHCPWEDGFIMSDLRHTERGFKWSQCSIEQFKHFLNGETATCLYNYPHESQMLHRLLPGTMLSLDEQCKRDRGTNACFKDARVCAQLFCFDSASGYCVSYRPAAEGSICGEGQVSLEVC